MGDRVEQDVRGEDNANTTGKVSSEGLSKAEEGSPGTKALERAGLHKQREARGQSAWSRRNRHCPGA